ncbi:MAG: hypothetical protein R3F17_00700 [Planctomycetota bacterium]
MPPSKALLPPPPLVLRIDDLGEYLLLVVPPAGREASLPGLPAGTVHWEVTLQDGPRWFLEGPGGALRLGGGSLGNLRGAWDRPPASPCFRFRPDEPVAGWPEGGLLLLAVGEDAGFQVGAGLAAFPVEGLEFPVRVRADLEALHVSCSGGVRVARGDKPFDPALHDRSEAWPESQSISFWCQARAGAPLFVHLAPLEGTV